MRINRLWLKNLNSLRGEFCIDFDEPPLGDSGIFAIIGPTGAGKTTILDAICVALYGQTPRLGLGQSAELMSRNSGDCFAEVEFSVTLGRYRCRWARRRARGLSDGKLQPTAMELVAIDDHGERIIEDQVRQVIERVEALTGLDFARFTRSVLLAQGSFAAFLKAKDNERAELLERMTGTGIYAAISVQAFSRARQERQVLDEMVAVNEHLDLMPAARLTEVHEEIGALEEAIRQGEERMTALRGQAALAAAYARVQAAQELAAAEVAAVRAAETTAEPERLRLLAAERALPLRAELQALEAVRRQLAEVRAAHQAASQDHERLAAEFDGAARAGLALAEEAGRFAVRAAQREADILEAERLDQASGLKGEALAASRELGRQLARQRAELSSAARDQEQALAAADGRLSQLAQILAAGQGDAGLGQDLSLIAQDVSELARQRRRFSDGRQQEEALGREIEGQAQTAERLGERRLHVTQTTTALSGQLVAAEAAWQRLVGDQGLAHLEAAVDRDRERVQLLEAFLAVQAEEARLHAELAGRRQRARELADGVAALRQQADQTRQQASEAEEALRLLSDRQALVRQVADYEADRERLSPGRPCPLCGSEHHPWRAALPDLVDEQPALESQRQRLGSLLGQLGALQATIQERQAAISGLEAELVGLQASADQRQEEMRQAALAAGLRDPSLALADKEALATGLRRRQEELAAVRSAKAEAEAILPRIMAAEREAAEVAVALATVTAKVEEQQAALSRCRQENARLLARGQELAAGLEPRLAVYGLPSLPKAGREEECLAGLRRRWQDFEAARAERLAVEAQASERRQGLAVLHSRISGLDARLGEETALADRLGQEIAALAAQRTQRLGRQSVAEARQDLAREREALRQRQEEAGRRQTALTAQVAAKAELLTVKGEEASRLEREGRELGQRLENRAAALGFTDAAALAAAMLPEAEFLALREGQARLALRRQRADERQREVESERRGLGEAAAHLEPEAIRQAMEAETALLTGHQQEVGGRREILRRQQALLAEHCQRAADIDRQRRELTRWQLLSDLIGSADGKKFRRFAQGLTLDHLIGLANRHLVRLSDRYLLRRHHDEELGLEIIDTYQADSVRPTGTLSGGEEFLVSLALALGLANLSGQSRIDSLFLDEGFGSLDTDTLETVLATLAALHETGKTIGVISHVEALKERIGVRIRLQKLAGGFSTLQIE